MLGLGFLLFFTTNLCAIIMHMYFHVLLYLTGNVECMYMRDVWLGV